MADAPSHPFFTDLARILNAGQSRSVLLHGNVYDLYESPWGEYVPLIRFLAGKCAVPGILVVVYELNGPIRIVTSDDGPDASAPSRGNLPTPRGPSHARRAAWDKLSSAWTAWRTGSDHDPLALGALNDPHQRIEREAAEAGFEQHVRGAVGQPTAALEFLRQLTLCSRAVDAQGRSWLAENLLILIEAADMLVPSGSGDAAGADVSRLNPADRHRVGVMQDWFADPGFMAGHDSVVLLTAARSGVHQRLTALPQMLSVEAPSPDDDARLRYIRRCSSRQASAPPKLWAGFEELTRLTAGLSIHALRQLLIGAGYSGRPLQPGEVIAKVQQFIQGQLGEDVVEFKKPAHTLDEVVGFSGLKTFLREELFPRLRATGPDALPGAAVAGPIGGGKTFVFEAAAAEMDLPVLVLKNIRSKWYGQTDVIFERLRRVLEALGKAVIFVDEADTQFGGLGAGDDATERRLTGKVQAMMSDPSLRGRVIWLLMTARIHRLSPDIRRPGRVGDLIIPVLDPPPGCEPGSDRAAFIRWMAEPALNRPPTDEQVRRLGGVTSGFSAAAFASLRSHLLARAASGPLSIEQVEAIMHDHLPPAIEEVRRYQTLQAMLNCTRRSLLPDPEVDQQQREQWRLEIHALESRGIS